MLLVGRRHPHWIADCCKRAGISLRADVPDVRPCLANAALVVVPLRIGGGSRPKIIEALAAGMCVVSTTVGTEGLDVRDGKHVVIADDPADFARGVISLLRHPKRRHTLARAGRTLVGAKYGWDRAATSLEEVWNQACTR